VVQLAFFSELLLLLVVLECDCLIRTYASVSLFLQILNALYNTDMNVSDGTHATV